MTGTTRHPRPRLAAAASRRFAQPVLGAARPRRLSGVAALVVLACISLCAPAQTSLSSSQPAARFAHVDIIIDPHGTPLAAYQIEFLADAARVQLVGIEGGDHPAFKQPPYYDLKALAGHRVIIAALNAGSDLPAQRMRVARLHLRIVGNQRPAMSAKLIVAASANEQTFGADVTVSEGASQ